MVKKVIGQTAIWATLLVMYFPILIIIAFSFTVSKQIGDWQGFSFDSFVALFTGENSQQIGIALGNTLIIALITTVCATLIGTAGAMGVYYAKKKTTKVLIEGVNQIPVVNAEIVIALSLTVMFVFVGSIIFRGANIFSFWTLLAGHLVITIPFVYLNVKPKLLQMDPSLYEAALDLGCSPTIALWKIVIPEILPGILSGALIAFTLSLDDFVITVFTRGPGLLSGMASIETLSTYVQAIIKKDALPHELRPLTTIIFFMVVSIVIAVTARRNYVSKHKHIHRKGAKA